MPEPGVQLSVRMIGHGEKEENQVANLLNKYEFYISTFFQQEEYQTTAFGDTDENVDQIRQLESALREEFPDADVSFDGLDRSKQATWQKSVDGLYCITIVFEDTESESEDTGSESVEENTITVESTGESETSGNSSEATTDSDVPEWRSSPPSHNNDDGENNRAIPLTMRESGPDTDEQGIEQPEEFVERMAPSKSENTDEPAPETVDEWRMWYPCPECQSTELIQVAETESQQRATEDGSYGGQEKILGTYNHIECSDCGVVLAEWTSAS
jgi:hypothetical protein